MNWRSPELNQTLAVKPLLALMAGNDFELSRRAKRTLYALVRHAGRPGAPREAAQVETELIAGLRTGSGQACRDVLWLLSEIGTNRAVMPVSSLLAEPELREDARCALTRIPGKKASAALRKAFLAAPEDFKFALAESLRTRGETVDGYPCQKRVPTKRTTVTPLAPKTK